MAMLAGCIVSALLDHYLGREVTAINRVSAFPPTLPPLSSPDFSLSTIQQLAPATLTVPVPALTEAVSIA